jgi:hypothetical protein
MEDIVSDPSVPNTVLRDESRAPPGFIKFKKGNLIE